MYVLQLILLVYITAVPGLCESPVYHVLSTNIISPDKDTSMSALKKDALFGYSITYQTKSKRLIISAPKASHTGQVFDCSLQIGACIPMLFQKFLPVTNEPNEPDLWFGATVKAGPDFIVTCAPRAIRHYEYNDTIVGTYAVCVTQDVVTGAKQNLQTVPYKDLTSDSSRHYNKPSLEHNMDSFGWAIAITQDSKVLIGGPAMATGRAIAYTTVKDIPSIITLERDQRKVVFNFGYSIAIGNFLLPSVECYAISSPYGEIGQGKILFFDKRQKEMIFYIKNEEVGALFGASLCTAKFGGRDSLLVGAPASSLKTSEFQGYTDVGAVYVYSNVKRKFQITRIIKGSVEGGYFGYVIANVGDLNLDGEDEVVIAAPYENEYTGAVYIYSGGDIASDQPEVSPLQKIQGEYPGHTFGLSLSPLDDYDENGCKELAIGIPGNNSVALLRSFAGISIKLTMELPDLINKFSEYTKPSASGVTFTINPCLNVEYPEKPKNVKTNITLSVNLTHPHAVLSGEKHISYIQTLSDKRPTHCRNLEVLLPKEGNYDQPMVFDIKASLQDDPMLSANFDPAKVTLGNGPQTLSKVILAPGSDLSMDVDITIPSVYLIGSTETEMVTIVMKNKGNAAYESCVRVRLAGVEMERPPAECAYKELLTCKPSAPIHNMKEWSVTVHLKTGSVTSDIEKIEIETTLYKLCDSGSPVGTPVMKTIKLTKDIERVHINGTSNGGPVMNVLTSELSSGVKNIKHDYAITNNGVTNWRNLKVDITLPQDLTFYISPADSCIEYPNHKASCAIKQLNKENKFNIMITMEINSGSPLLKQLERGKLEIVSQIKLMIGDKVKSERVSTTVTPQRREVPLWMLIAAAIVGILILIIIGFALHECGFLRTKNKERLESLKKEVHRQSMRRNRASIVRVNPPNGSGSEALLNEACEEQHNEDGDIQILEAENNQQHVDAHVH